MNHGGVLLVLLTISHMALGRELGTLMKVSHPIKQKLCTLGEIFPVFFSSRPDLR